VLEKKARPPASNDGKASRMIRELKEAGKRFGSFASRSSIQIALRSSELCCRRVNAGDELVNDLVNIHRFALSSAVLLEFVDCLTYCFGQL
jgi:hypothetical protein